MSGFKAKIHKIRFRLGLCPDPTGEFTVFFETSWLDLLARRRNETEEKGRELTGKN